MPPTRREREAQGEEACGRPGPGEARVEATPLPAPARWRWPALALVTLSAVVRVGLVRNAALDPDESQHLHASWLVAQGHVPFVDFWEHHTPLLYALLAPLTRWFAEDPSVYFAGRAVMSVAGGAAMLLVYRLARRVSPSTAMAAVALLAFLSRFVEHTTEVRPDAPALVAWLGTLLALVRWNETGRPGWLWGAGLALGTAGAFTPKAVYGALGVAATVVLASCTGEAGVVGRVAARLGRVAAGALLPVLALVGWLWTRGRWPAVQGAIAHVLLENLRYPDPTKMTPIPEESLGVLLLAVAGLLLTLGRGGRAVLRHPLHGPLLVPAGVITLILLLPTTPAVYRHVWLPVLPVVAIYAGIALTGLLERARDRRGVGARALLVLALLVGVAVPASGQIRNALHDANRQALQRMRRLLRESCPGEPVLDGTALSVFRPAAYRYGVLVAGVRGRIARGVVAEEELVEDLSRARARVGYLDWRLRALTGPVGDFIHTHYVTEADGMLVLGTYLVDPGGTAGGQAHIDALVAGLYRLATGPDLALAIDGAAVRPGFVRLARGQHEVTWVGRARQIRLTAATCPERHALVSLAMERPLAAVTRRPAAGAGPRRAPRSSSG